MSNLINLDDLGRKAAAIQIEIASDLSSAAGKMWDLGEMLNGAKARVNHGRWGVWLSRHGIHERTARRCMKINRDYTREAAIKSTGRKLLAAGSKTDTRVRNEADVSSAAGIIAMLRAENAALERKLWFLERQAEWLDAVEAGHEKRANTLYGSLVTQLEYRIKTAQGGVYMLRQERDALREMIIDQHLQAQA